VHDVDLDALADAADPRVGGRARLVRATLADGPVRAAQAHGVSRRTASTWLGRYRRGGVAALRTPGRRAQDNEAARRAVLTAPLWMSTSKWSSRSIAEEVGVSQSFVARAWRHAQTSQDGAAGVADLVEDSGPTLLGLLVTRERAVLVLRLTAARLSDRGAPAGARTQRALRTLLASDLVRGGIEADPESTVEREFWERAVANADGSPLLALVSRPGGSPAPVAVSQACADPAEWQALLRLLVRCPEVSSRRPAAELETEIRKWYRDDRRHAFAWIVRPGSAAPSPRSQGLVRQHRGLGDEIIATIQQHVVAGTLSGGDRVTESFLAGRLRTTRAQVRAALQLLERDGLLTVTSGRAAVVPLLTSADVAETYAARRALGAIVVRAAVRWRPSARLAVLRTLEVLEQCGRTNDVETANQGDLDFQNALAAASGLARIGPMLLLLSEQLRMFVAVMGVRYAYPVELILDRDREIFQAIDEGNGDLAAERWRVKLDEAMAYMFERMAERGDARRRPG
jgi:DNA-binding GntR family transcriptional regulator